MENHIYQLFKVLIILLAHVPTDVFSRSELLVQVNKSYIFTKYSGLHTILQRDDSETEELLKNVIDEPSKETPLQPASTTSPQTTTTPPQPDSTKPSQPGLTTPPQLGSTTPPQTYSTTPPQPDSIKPSQYGSTTPPQDGSTTPPQFGFTTPPQPSSTTPPQPDSTKAKFTINYSRSTLTYEARSNPISNTASYLINTTLIENLSTPKLLLERFLVNVNLVIFLNSKLDFNEKQRLEFELFKKFKRSYGFSSLEIVLFELKPSDIRLERKYKNLAKKLRMEYNLRNLLKNASAAVNGIEKTIPLMETVTLNGRKIVVNTSKTMEIFQEKEREKIFSYRNRSCELFSSNRLCQPSDHCENIDKTQLGFNCTHKCNINNPCSSFHRGAIWETGVCGLNQKFDTMCRCPGGTMRVSGSRGCMKQGFIVGISVTLSLLVIVSFFATIGILLKIEKSKRKISNHFLSGEQNMVMENVLPATGKELVRSFKQADVEIPGSTVHA